MKKEKYRWVICAGCTLVVLSISGLTKTGFSIYQPYLISAGGLRDTQVSALVMLFNACSLISFLPAVKIYNRIGIRMTIFLSVFSGGLSFFLYGIAESYVVYCAAAILSGTAYGVGGILPASILIRRWFQEHAGLALGICMAGSGIASAVGTPIITSLVERHSMQYSFKLEAVVMLLLAVVIWGMLRDWPDGLEEKKVEEEKVRANFAYVNRKEKLILYGSMIFLGSASVSTSFLPVLYKTEGFEAMTVSFLISLMGIVLMIGKCIYGQLADRIGEFRAGNLFYSMLGLSLLSCCFCRIGGTRLAVVTMILYGFGAATISVDIPLVAASVSAENSYAAVQQRMQVLFICGNIFFSYLPGVIAEYTHSYIPAFGMLTVTASTGFILLQCISWRVKRKKESDVI